MSPYRKSLSDLFLTARAAAEGQLVVDDARRVLAAASQMAKQTDESWHHAAGQLVALILRGTLVSPRFTAGDRYRIFRDGLPLLLAPATMPAGTQWLWQLGRLIPAQSPAFTLLPPALRQTLRERQPMVPDSISARGDGCGLGRAESMAALDHGPCVEKPARASGNC